MLRKRRWLFINASVFCILFISSCVALSLIAQSMEQPIDDAATIQQIDTVTRQNIVDTISLSGKLEPVERAELGFSVTSRVIEILVQPGSRVTEDQSLARLDTRDLELAVESARASLAQAQAELDSLRQGPTDEELAQARQSLTSAQSGVVQAQQSIAGSQLDQEQTLVDIRRQLEEAQNGIEQKRIGAQQQRDQLSITKTTAEKTLDQRTELLVQAQDAYSTAKWELDYVERTGLAPESEGQPRESRIELNSFQRQEFTTQLTRSEHALRDAERAVEQALVVYEQAQRDEVTQGQVIDLQLQADEEAYQQLEANLVLQLEPQELAQLDPEQAGLANAHARSAQLQQQSEQQNLATANTSLELAQSQYDRTAEGAAESSIAAAQAQLLQAEAQLAEAETRLSQATLQAPFDGIVIAVDKQTGETVTAEESIITLVRSDELLLIGDVGELDILDVKAGQSASVHVDVLPTTSMSGTLTHVSLAPIDIETVQPGTDTLDSASRYEVHVSIPNPDPEVRLGMVATAQIRLVREENALVLPLRAIHEKEGQFFVERLMGTDSNAIGEAFVTERVEVTVGYRTAEGIEILNGLEEGEQVVSQTLPSPTPTSIRADL